MPPLDLVGWEIESQHSQEKLSNDDVAAGSQSYATHGVDGTTCI